MVMELSMTPVVCEWFLWSCCRHQLVSGQTSNVTTLIVGSLVRIDQGIRFNRWRHSCFVWLIVTIYYTSARSSPSSLCYPWPMRSCVMSSVPQGVERNRVKEHCHINYPCTVLVTAVVMSLYPYKCCCSSFLNFKSVVPSPWAMYNIQKSQIILLGLHRSIVKFWIWGLFALVELTLRY